MITGLSRVGLSLPTLSYNPITGSFLPLSPLRMVLVGGQSLSIGTMAGAPNPKPTQPELSSRYKQFSGVQAVGVEGTVVTSGQVNTLSQFNDTATEGQGGFYSGASGFFKRIAQIDDPTQTWVWGSTGKGGTAIELLDWVGGYPSWLLTNAYTQGTTVKYPVDGKLYKSNATIPANTTWATGTSGATWKAVGEVASSVNAQTMLTGALGINAETNVTSFLFSQGEQNSADPSSEVLDGVTYTGAGGYTFKLSRYKTNQIALIQSVFPSSNPVFLLDQIGGLGGKYQVGRVQLAQTNAARTGLAVVSGPKYWINRIYPNDAAAPERLHLNVKGYQYQNEMFARALTSYLENGSFKPCHITSWTFYGNFIEATVHTPTGGDLVIDTTSLPAFPGAGIQIEKPSGVLISPTVTVSGKKIIIDCGEFVWPDFRVLVGYSPVDITPDGTAYPNSNYMPGTNIRCVDSITTVNVDKDTGLPNSNWYDWLMLDQYTVALVDQKAGEPSLVGQYGTELWRTSAPTGYSVPNASAITMTSVPDQMTLTINGVVQAPTARVSPLTGAVGIANYFAANWWTKVGKTYRCSLNLLSSPIVALRFNFGGGFVNIPAGTPTGVFTSTIVYSGTLGTCSISSQGANDVQFNSISVQELL